MRSVSHSSLLFFLSFSLVLPGHRTWSAEVITAEAKVLRQACLDPAQVRYSPATKDANGKRVYYRYLAGNQKTKTFNCEGVGVGPVTRLPAKLAPSPEITEASTGCINCSKPSALSEASVATQLAAACPPSKKANSSCVGQISCEITSGIQNFILPVLGTGLGKAMCPKTAAGGCAGAIAAGVGRALVDLVKGIGYLAEAGWGWAKQKTKSFFSGFFSNKKVHRVDNTMSKVMLFLQSLSWAKIKMMVTNTKKFLGDIVSAIINGMVESAQLAANCGKWSGVPLTSKCLEPGPGWNCMDCSQKARSVCAFAGVVGSDFVLMFVGGVGFAKVAAKFGKASKAINQIQHIADVASKTKVGKIVRTTTAVAVVPVSVTGKAALKVLTTIEKLPGFKQYAYVSEKAFLAGVQVGSRGSARAATVAARSAQAMGRAEDVDDAIPNLTTSNDEIEVASQNPFSTSAQDDAIRNGVAAEQVDTFDVDESRVLNYCAGGKR
jgi:hypothetical protein